MTANIAERLCSAETLRDGSAAMEDWGVEACVLVVVPMEKGMGPKKVMSLVTDRETRLPDVAFPLASISKHITSLALSLALERTGLSWRTKVTDILPDFALDDGIQGGEVVVEDLLCHRTGLPGWDVMYAPGLDQGFLDKIAHLPVLYPASSSAPAFQYNSLLYDVAARLIPRLVDKTIEQFVQEELFTPLELTASYHANKMELKAQGKIAIVSGDGVEAVDAGFRLEDCGEAWGAGRLWMTCEDLARWLVCAPHISGFEDIAKARITDPDPGLFFPDEPQGYGLGLRSYTHRGVKVLCHNGSIPGFATQLTWLPDLKVGFAVLTNSDLGGTYLRSLMALRLIENAAGLEKRDWKAVLDERYKAATSPQIWMEPLPGCTASSSTSNKLLGTWTHPSFGSWTISPADVVLTRPALSTLPSLPGLYATRKLFTPLDDGAERYVGCYECKVGDKAFYGMPFEARVVADKMEVRRLSGAEDQEVDAAHPLSFTRT